MKSFFPLITTSLLLGASNAVADPIPAPEILAERQYNTLTYEGCYSSSAGLSYNASYQWNTKGYCQTLCVPGKYAVQATTNKTDCWCGNDMPPSSAKVDDSFCDDTCAGYGTEMCGSADSKYFSVYLTGLTNSAVTAGTTTSASSASKTPSATSSSKPSVVTLGGQTVVVTASASSSSPATSSSSSSSSGGGPSKAGIAAGVVVGIVAIAAIAGGIFLFLRNKKRREVEEEYRRNAAANSFLAGGGKPPNSSGGSSSFTDTRLDPVMAQRRMSDGSIADNQDYSRRILKVTNA